MRHPTLLCSTALLLLLAISCEKTSDPEAMQKVQILQEPCALGSKAVKKAVGLEGIVYFDSTLQQYVILRAEPGTYDVVDYGIICGRFPENVQLERKAVVFSGTYREYPQQTGAAGATYYYLELTKLALKPR